MPKKRRRLGRPINTYEEIAMLEQIAPLVLFVGIFFFSLPYMPVARTERH